MRVDVLPATIASISDTLPLQGWLIAGLICAGGLSIWGLGDVSRFSLYRTRAIASVCFRESIRRRVLWLIPLTIVGAIVCCQLQKATDEQDVIRQTTKFCLFATGLVVIMAAMILACTNLPREIDNRVIFTIVTKPATRLELIIGKIAGFSFLTGVILVIMGLFTYGYVSWRNHQLQSQLTLRLQNETALSDIERQTLEHYRDAGMMTALEYVRPTDFQIFGRLPTRTTTVRSMLGNSEAEMTLPFVMDKDTLFKDPRTGKVALDQGIGDPDRGLIVGLRMKWQRYGPISGQQSSPTTEPDASQPSDTASAPTELDERPLVATDVLDANQFSLLPGKSGQNAQLPQAKNAHGDRVQMLAENRLPDHADPAQVTQVTDAVPVYIFFPPVQARQLFTQDHFFIHVTPVSQNVEYFADSSSAFVAIAPPFAPGLYAPAAVDGAIPGISSMAEVEKRADGAAAQPVFAGRLTARNGQTLRGGDPDRDTHLPLAIFRFRNIDLHELASTKTASMALSVDVEREGLEAETDREDPTLLAVSFLDPKTGELSNPMYAKAENGLVSYLDIPTQQIAEHNFDLVIRCNTPGHYLGLTNGTISLVSSHQPFAFNLFKSLLITWMMTVLVIAIAVCCSTFLSWPIAFILTIVFVVGHWAISQVSDVSDRTLGRAIATDLNLTDASSSEVVAQSVNTLSASLKKFNVILPDTDRFASIEDIEKGIIISADRLGSALGVLVAFGLPTTVLAYIFLKKKEVAP